jgi:hypothetical protein
MRPYRVIARNTATDSANRIHDDGVARRYGFSGGLVPGVVVHAYLTHPPAERWGLDWVARGTIRSRFRQPVYDGEAVVVEPQGVDAPSGETLVLRRPSGDQAATAVVGSPVAAGNDTTAAVGDLARWGHPPLPAEADRPPASEETFAAHPVLGTLDVHFRVDLAHHYLDAIGETLPMYREEGVAHPGWLIARANHVLAANVVLGPWIHVESEVRHFDLVHDGDLVSTRAVVLATTERKGHRLVELDVLMVNGRERPILRARHVAIYRIRDPDGG